MNNEIMKTDIYINYFMLDNSIKKEWMQLFKQTNHYYLVNSPETGVYESVCVCLCIAIYMFMYIHILMYLPFNFTQLSTYYYTIHDLVIFF